MIASEGSWKWVLSIFIAIILVVICCYPHEVLFVLTFIWDLIVLNVRPLIEEITQFISEHWHS